MERIMHSYAIIQEMFKIIVKWVENSDEIYVIYFFLVIINKRFF